MPRAILLVLVVAGCARQSTTAGKTDYTPKWHVGDWWVVKTSEQSINGECVWRYRRTDIVGVERVGERDCFVVETRVQGPSGEVAGKTKVMHYVRTDDWLVVRQVMTFTYNDTLCPPRVWNAPLGLFGPFQGGEPRLPRFPLQPGDSDTMFRLVRRHGFSAELREISSVADPALVRRLLDEGDSTGRRVVRTTGVVRQVRNEVGGDLDTPVHRRIVQSLQFWSDDLPWRVYEELVQYDGPRLTRRVVERSWLIAVGHMRK